jgi:hypothetical protein
MPSNEAGRTVKTQAFHYFLSTTGAAHRVNRGPGRVFT